MRSYFVMIARVYLIEQFSFGVRRYPYTNSAATDNNDYHLQIRWNCLSHCPFGSHPTLQPIVRAEAGLVALPITVREVQVRCHVIAHQLCTVPCSVSCFILQYYQSVPFLYITQFHKSCIYFARKGSRQRGLYTIRSQLTIVARTAVSIFHCHKLRSQDTTSPSLRFKQLNRSRDHRYNCLGIMYVALVYCVHCVLSQVVRSPILAIHSCIYTCNYIPKLYSSRDRKFPTTHIAMHFTLT